jgi:hypothetical protein
LEERSRDRLIQVDFILRSEFYLLRRVHIRLTWLGS